MILYKKTDKGNAMALLDSSQDCDIDDYITETHSQIFNDKYHKPLESPVYINTIVSSITVQSHDVLK